MMSLNTSVTMRWSVSVLWSACALLVFMTIGVSSTASWLTLAVAGLMPPLMYLALWNEGPPPTIAEVLRATEERR